MSMQDVVTKKAFAEAVGVTPSCVSHWIGEKKLHGDALVGRGCRARIRTDIALEQLRKNLDIDQRLGANGKARLDGDEPSEPETLEGRIKRERLDQLALANAAAREEAAVRSGRFIKTDDARQQMGRIAGRLMTIFDASLAEMAEAIMAAPPATRREAVRLLRATWSEIRGRHAQAIRAEVEALPSLLDDEGETNAACCEC